ncbi:hypothetical protein ACEPAG_2299 [Sanghuangporus baumii]
MISSGKLASPKATSAPGTSKKRSLDETEISFQPPPSKKKVYPIFSKPSETINTSESAGAFQWKKLPFLPSTCLHGDNLNAEIRHKIAAFDLDGTVVKFLPSKGELEWEFWHTNMSCFLKEAHDSGHTVVLFSNQLYPEKKLVKWREKIGSIARALHEVPFLMFTSTARDGYRKPMPGMWVALERLANEAGVVIDKGKSFFVGDAAGRKGDFASTDRKFAENIGVKFCTPEEYFLKQSAQPYQYKGTHVSKLPTNKGPRIIPTSSPILPVNGKKPEMVLFVGFPASGKTTLFERVFLPAGYEHVNQDTLGSRPKCLKAAEEFLQKMKSCVVDNTNRDKKTRQFYLNLAETLDIPVRCFKFKISRELAWHNNLYRTFCLPLLSGSTAAVTKERKLIPYSAFVSFSQCYEEPTIDEGFKEVKTVNWQFEGDAEEERYWRMWLQIDGK